MTRKNTVIIIVSTLLFLCMIVLVINILLNKFSKTYNDRIDQKNYKQLCDVLTSDNIDKIMIAKQNQPDDYITNHDVFKTLEYKGSGWNIESFDWGYTVRVYLKNNNTDIVFGNDGSDQFLVTYKDRRFFVVSSELNQLVTDTLG